jgi:hypothetical protein
MAPLLQVQFDKPWMKNGDQRCPYSKLWVVDEQLKGYSRNRHPVCHLHHCLSQVEERDRVPLMARLLQVQFDQPWVEDGDQRCPYSEIWVVSAAARRILAAQVNPGEGRQPNEHGKGEVVKPVLV